MTLSDIAIERPVFAWMVMLALVLFGWLCFRDLGISEYPDIDFPVLTVSATWDGAAPEVLETQIVDPLEEAILSVEGIKDLRSTIKQGNAAITIEFELSRDIDAALQEVQSNINRVQLPLEVRPPIITKSNPDDEPILWVAVSGGKSFHELVSYTDTHVKERLQTVPGVGEVTLPGVPNRNLRVWVDNKKLREYELTILDLRNAIIAGHRETSAGKIENHRQELNLRVMGEGATPEEVGEILINARGGKPIYNTIIKVKNVAKVEDGLNDIRVISRLSGVPCIALGIRMQRGKNAVEVGRLAKAKLNEISQLLPPDFRIHIAWDGTKYIEEAVAETEFTLLLSALATAVVCWLFLGSWGPTFNVLLSIPTSIIGTFIVIHLMGFTLNIFTILALALAIGIVVDDAIMVLDNIYRHRDSGKERVLAARDGAREITFAAVAASVAVIAVFIPLIFVKGIIGRYFFQFGVTISAAVAFSLLEAITLTPMRCAQILEHPTQKDVIENRRERLFNSLALAYRQLLRVCLRWRLLVLVASLIIFVGSLALLGSLRKELAPSKDQSFFEITIRSPIGSSLDYTNEKALEVERFLSKNRDIAHYLSEVGSEGSNSAKFYVQLTPRRTRLLSQLEIMNLFRERISTIQDIKFSMQDLSIGGAGAGGGYPVEFDIRGPSWAILKEKADEIISHLESHKLAVDLVTKMRFGMPEVRVHPDRAQASQNGVTIESIATTVQAAIGGTLPGKFTNDGHRYDVRMSLNPEERVSTEDISNLEVRNAHGVTLPLGKLTHVETVPTLQTIVRKNRERSISVSGNIPARGSQGDVVKQIDELGKTILPRGYTLTLDGGAKEMIEAFQNLLFVLWFGIVVAYMILASQFNNLHHPFIVLLALPFSITGALAAMYLGNQSLNIYSIIGVILLMGIAKKNSILLVEFMNLKCQREGHSTTDAILLAGTIRLRPILMTSLATMAAAIPPALAIGPGAESRISMSVALLGGILVSTVFTLIVVPCAYSILAQLEHRLLKSKLKESKETNDKL